MLKKFNVYLYDNIDRKYDRKNLYLYEISKLQEEIEYADGNEKVQLKKKLKELINNKNNHEYNKKLSDYKNKEKLFIEKMNKKVGEFKGRKIKLCQRKFKN